MKQKKYIKWGWLFILLAVLPTLLPAQISRLSQLKVSANHRFLITADGKPFFWLGDTGWLLFSKLTKEEAANYLEDRRQKGFNVIQVMVVHDVKEMNVYGDSALVNKNIAAPLLKKRKDGSENKAYDYWDHVEYIVDLAAQKGIYMALVPIWGSAMKDGKVTPAQAKTYANFLVSRFAKKSNIIWMNGGDIKGSEGLEVWKTIGTTLYTKDTNHLITFHPRGRTSSSTWFHMEKWLAFNSFQSGHRRYDQDTSASEQLHYGEDNWKYAQVDYKRLPVKPVVDAEPSYENIPHGLHDTTEKRWQAADVRRYGYWSVFAGCFGYTYGDNAVMQFHKPTDKSSAYGAKDFWYDAINDTGAGQMQWLKKLMLSRPYTDRIPDQSLIAGTNGEQYNRLAATRGKNYAFIYTYTGKPFSVQMAKIAGPKVKASWYDPRTGNTTPVGSFSNTGARSFTPPGQQQNGNDWVLILDGEK